MADPQKTSTLPESTLATQIVDQVDSIVRAAETAGKPMEIDPYRGQLFELFVTAQGAGLTTEDSSAENAEVDLSADGLCHQLSQRWGLKDAAQESFVKQSNLKNEQLQKMRSLWSVMRMWMEWNYAWSRWDEFHRPSDNSES